MPKSGCKARAIHRGISRRKNTKRIKTMKYPRVVNPLFAATLAIVSIAAFAESPGMTTNNEVAPEWTKADTNHDGFLTRDELVPFSNLVHHFDKIDSDADMKVSESEYRSWMGRERSNK